MALHGLVDVHRVKRGDIEPGEPHIADNDNPERVICHRFLEPFGKRFPTGLVPYMRLPRLFIAGRAGHNYLEYALVILIRMPVRPDLRYRAVDSTHIRLLMQTIIAFPSMPVCRCS